MALKYQSIQNIVYKCYRHPLLQDIPFDAFIDYAVDFMRIVGAPTLFEEKVVHLNIENYRAQLPIDLEHVNAVLVNGKRIRYSTDLIYDDNNAKMSSSIPVEPVYKLLNNMIYTSFPNGNIEVAYRAIAVDDNNFPLIPDNSSFTRALEAYIKKQWFTILHDLNKITHYVLQDIQQNYAWAVGDCQTEFQRMNLDQAESLYNSWQTLLIRKNEYSNGFINNGFKERLKIF